MKPLTPERKQQMLEAIENLGDEHWDEVRENVARENKEFEQARKALTPSHAQLQDVFDI